MTYRLFDITANTVVTPRCEPCCPDVVCASPGLLGFAWNYYSNNIPLFSAAKYFVDIAGFADGPPIYIAEGSPPEAVLWSNVNCTDGNGTFPLYGFDNPVVIDGQIQSAPPTGGYATPTPGNNPFSSSGLTFWGGGSLAGVYPNAISEPLGTLIGRNGFFPVGLGVIIALRGKVFVSEDFTTGLVNEQWQLTLSMYAASNDTLNLGSGYYAIYTYACSCEDFNGCGSAVMNLISATGTSLCETMPSSVVIRSVAGDPANCPCPCFVSCPTFNTKLYVLVTQFPFPQTRDQFGNPLPITNFISYVTELTNPPVFFNPVVDSPPLPIGSPGNMAWSAAALITLPGFTINSFGILSSGIPWSYFMVLYCNGDGTLSINGYGTLGTTTSANGEVFYALPFYFTTITDPTFACAQYCSAQGTTYTYADGPGLTTLVYPTNVFVSCSPFPSMNDPRTRNAFSDTWM